MSQMGRYFILFSIRCHLSNVDVSLSFSFNNQKQSTDMMPIPVKVRCQLTNYYSKKIQKTSCYFSQCKFS